MKRKLILALSLLFTMSLSVSAFAAENTTANAENTATAENYKSYAGITPGSIFYSLDKALDNLSVKLASTPSDKIEKLIEIERERLGEIQTLVDSKKVDLGVNTLDALNALADQTSTEINSILNDNNISEDGTKNTDMAIKDAEDFNAASSTALNELKDKLPENAAKKVAAVAEMQSAKKAAVQQMVAARHELNTAKKTVTTAKKALADATKLGDTAAIEKATSDLETANAVLLEKKTAFDNAKKNKSEAIKNSKVGNGHKAKKDDNSSVGDKTTDSSETNTTNNTSTNTTGTTEDNAATTTAPENNTTAAPAENNNTSSTTEIAPAAPNATITKEVTTTEVSKASNDEKIKEHKSSNGNSAKHNSESKKNDNKKGK